MRDAIHARSEERRRMVEQHIASRGVRDEAVLEAMREVPRERFVPEPIAELAYDDTPLPIEEGQTISQPYIVALMAEALGLAPGAKVLEIGAGSGYAAAVLSRIAGEVFTIERHAALAQSAATRVRELGYDNVAVRTGDGTLGWPEHAPYDGIVVAAGGPDVPQSLLEQLAIGGRLVMPVGRDARTQELVRITREAIDRFRREDLGKVQFVPLIGAEGWAVDGAPIAPHRMRKPLRVETPDRRRISALIDAAAEPIDDIERVDLAPLLRRIGDAQVVLIGEATHGTSEFYRMRARITRALIEDAGFTVVGIEGDWPDVATLDRHVRQQPPPHALREGAFSRFPTWMWRNSEMQAFVAWLAAHNRSLAPEAKVSLHGLDVYGLHNAIGVVLDYLDQVDPEAAGLARARYGCFSPWESDPATYGRMAVSSGMRGCEKQAVAALSDLLAKRLDYAAKDGDAFMEAARAAAVVKNAERYYRVMYYGSRESWNLRDRHMYETLEAVRAHRGGAKAVVWAHNSHVGNAAATEMGIRGELNVGQLAKQALGKGSYLIGFGTDHGTVAAASNWDEPMQVMGVRPAHADSYERIARDCASSRFMVPLRAAGPLREALLSPHLERAIGVVYRPDTELASHYFHAVLPAQFDEYVYFAETRALEALPVATKHRGVPETYPFGL